MLNLAKMYTQYFPGLFCLMAVELEDGIVAELGAAGAAFGNPEWAASHG